MEVPDNIVNWFVGGLTATFGYVWQKQDKKINQLREDITKHREHVLTWYPTRKETREQFEDLKETLDKQGEKLDKIIDQLAKKADRT